MSVLKSLSLFPNMLKYWYLYLDTFLKKDWANSWWKIWFLHQKSAKNWSTVSNDQKLLHSEDIDIQFMIFYLKNDSKRIWFYNLLILPESCRGLIVSQNYLIIPNPFWLQFPQIVLQNYKQSADVHNYCTVMSI